MRVGIDRRDETRARFWLGKQAAAVGRPHFGPPPAGLGSVEISLQADEPGELLRLFYHIAPDTKVPKAWAELPPSERPEDWREQLASFQDDSDSSP